MKKCKDCERALQKSEFYKNKCSRDGLFSTCKMCVGVRQSIRDIRNRIKTDPINHLDGETFKEFRPNYLVSNFGRVYVKEHYGRSGSFVRGKFLKLTRLSTGYPSISYGSKKYTVHRLVAKLFVPNPKKYSHVNHKDGIRDNNHYTNLEWCSHKDNVSHGVKMGSYARKLTSEDVASIRKSKLSVKELTEKHNVSDTNIRLILNNKIWKYT